MSARLAMFLRAFVIGCCVVAFTSVAQTEPQRTDEHHDNGQQRPVEQNAGQNGVNRPQQQQGTQQYRGEHPPEQYQQHQQGQTQQQAGQQNGQRQSHPQQQQSGQYGTPQQQNGHDWPQQQQNGQQRQYQQNNDQQHYQQRGGQQYTRDSNHGGQYRPNSRPQQWGHAPAHRPTFNFRSNDRGILQRYYATRLHGVDRMHRPVFRIGGYLPYEDLGFFVPVPPDAWGSLPPIPYGYVAGYWDGYVVVYDPNTGYILYVADLM